MRYITPQNVTSPRDFVQNVQILFDGGNESFSIARLEWEGGSCIGIRWNIARREWDDPSKQSDERECVGMPSSRGYPVWFVLPNEIRDGSFDLIGLISRGKTAFADLAADPQGPTICAVE
jgi:hypothetical protein